MDPIEKTIISQVFALLSAGKAKDSPEILALVGAVADRPDVHDFVIKLIRVWNAPAPFSSAHSRVAGALRNPNVLAGSAGIAGIASIPWLQQLLEFVNKEVTLPTVTSPVTLFGIIAGLGALAGFGYSLFVYRGLAIPHFGKQEGVLVLSQMGFLNETGFGAVAAVTTVWLASIGLGAVQPGANAPPVNLLNWSVVIGACVSGWYGARMRTTKMEKDLLKQVVVRTAASEPLPPESAKAIDPTSGAAKIAAMALGGVSVMAGTRDVAAVAAPTETTSPPPVAPPAAPPGPPPAPAV